MQDYDALIQLQSERRKRALDVQGQPYQPAQGQMIGRRYVPPGFDQALVQGLRQFGAMRDASDSEKQITELSEKKRTATAEALRNVGALMEGTPENAPIDGMGPTMPAVKPNPSGAFRALMQMPDAAMQQAGMAGMIKIPEMQAAQQERIDNRAFKSEEAQLARQARAEELNLKMQDARASQAERLAAQKELREMMISAQKDTQRMIAANRPERQAQIIQTENGPMQLVNGQAVPIVGPDGKPVGNKPASATSVTEKTKTNDANDAIMLLQQAAPLINDATGSGIGAGVDWLGRQFGEADKGAKNIGQLKAISGMLIAKMPKMSGPQSDKDVLLYREMAGNIGDPTIPNAIKRDAMKAIAEIQARYAGSASPELNFGDKPKAQAAPVRGGAPTRIKVDAQGNIVP